MAANKHIIAPTDGISKLQYMYCMLALILTMEWFYAPVFDG